MNFEITSYKSAWEVFLLFLIPIGGGIPAGVVLAKARGLEWPVMMALYLVSDIVLACIFEPLMNLFRLAGRKNPKFGEVLQQFRMNLQKTTGRYGVNPNPLTLIFISFGVDPMTGRAAALYAGHGFITGWTVAIIGDMFYFALIMASTLWLNGVLGDGTWTAVIIMVAMIAIPAGIRRIRARFGPPTGSTSSRLNS